MRVSSLVWLAVAPLLVACGADAAAIDDSTSSDDIIRHPVSADGPTSPAADP
ncbi:hypothetical protein BH11MYX4_BH11MYX4_55710 [soil metagenome]